ncbi:MAG: hypothetical protein HY717_12575 [Planctomycetes bacterium]|nr:hypothetical protein [Planctomycetota bacterium]
MNQREFFEKVLAALKALEIPYMITGSVGAIIYGEPRLTNDMDVVVELPADRIDDLSKQFPSHDFYLAFCTFCELSSARKMCKRL